MPYTISNPPDQIKGLPKKAQEVWIKSYNAAHIQYEGNEEKSNGTAWAAVKNAGYEKDKDGKWKMKETVLPKEPEKKKIKASEAENVAWRKIQQAIENALNSRFGKRTWVEEYFPEENNVRKGEIIFSRHAEDMNETELRKIAYEIDEKGDAKLATDSTKVERDWVEIKESLQFLEAKGDSGSIFKVVVIKAGLSANGNNYPAEVLQKAVPLFEGAKVLSRSDADHINDTDKSVENIVGWLKNARWERASIVADLYVMESAQWLRDKLSEVIEKNKKDLFGLSIVASGKGRMKKTPRGKIIREVESITKVYSVDVVVDPAAGGRILKLVAAKNNNQIWEVQTMEKLLKLLETKAPDQYKKIDLENITEDEVITLLTEALVSKEEIETAKAKKKPDNASADSPATTTVGDKGQSTKLAEAEEKTKNVLSNLEKQQEMLEKKTCELALAESLSSSDLPEPVKVQIRNRFCGRVFDETELVDEIKTQKDTLSKLTEAGNVFGLGTPKAEVGKDEKEKTLKAMDGFFENVDIDGVPRFKSFRECYILMTGDKNLTGKLREATYLHKFTEALTSSSWAEILGDSITRKMIKEYNTPGLQNWRKIVSDITSIGDFRTNRRMRMGGYGLIPAVAETGTYLELTSPTDEEATFAVSKRGGLETVTMEMIANDDVGAIRRIPQKLGRSAVITLYRFVFDFIEDNATCTYDSVALFNAAHGSNLGSAALGATSLTAAKVVMAKQTGYGASTDIMGLIPKYLLVPTELEDMGFRLVESVHAIGSGEGTPRYTDREPNIHGSYGLEVIVVPYWSETDHWALVCNVADCPTFEIGFFQGREEPELFVQDAPNQGSMFTADKITYKIRHIYGGAILDHRGMYKAEV